MLNSKLVDLGTKMHSRLSASRSKLENIGIGRVSLEENENQFYY
jgi:hypothetical protein